MSGLSKAKLIDTMPEPLAGLMVNAVGYFYRRNRYSGRMRRTLDDWRLLERCDADVLRAYQVQRLRHILNSAAHTPYYSRVFRKHDFDPERVSSLDDLRRLPVLEKRDLVRHGHEMIVPGYDGRLSRRRSSGTTGQPVTYFQPYRMAFDQTFAMLYQFYGWHGFKPLERRATMAGRYLGRKARGVVVRNRMENQLLLGVHSLSASSIERYMGALEAFHPAILQAHPSALILLRQLVDAAALPPPRVPLVTFTAESLSEAERQSLRTWLGGAMVFGTYGSGENVVAAGECRALSGYHVHPAVGICELVDIDGRAEILGTSLLNDAMPLLRYRTGDVGLGLAQSSCSCGCTWPRLTGLQGRIDDLISLPDGTPIASVVLRTGIAAVGTLNSPYSIMRHKKPNEYTLVVYSDSSDGHLAGTREVIEYLHSIFGPQARIGISIRPINEMLTARAKHRLIIEE